MTKLILASQSPRRRRLLKQFDIPFDVVVADIDETPLNNEPPDRMTQRLAEQKALTVFRQIGKGHRVLGGDTTVAIDGNILGKPKDKEQAISMLTALSGRSHFVHSAVALTDETGCKSLISTTSVTFQILTTQQILEYCETSDPYDKAGAYGIQGRAGQFVSALQGSYSGVVGLPLWETHQLLLASG